MPRSPGGSTAYNTYAGQLAVNVQDSTGQWTDDDYQRAQSSSVSPRTGYCSNTSTPHSSGGSYGPTTGVVNSYGAASTMGALSSSPGSIFNTATMPSPWHQALVQHHSTHPHQHHPHQPWHNPTVSTAAAAV